MTRDDVRNELVRTGREFLAALVDLVWQRYGKLKPEAIYKLADEGRISQEEKDAYLFIYYNTETASGAGRYSLTAPARPETIPQRSIWDREDA